MHISVMVPSQSRVEFWDIKKSDWYRLNLNTSRRDDDNAASLFFCSTKSELSKTGFKKTSLLMHLASENGSIFNKQVKWGDVSVMPGSLNLQHLLGPRRCRYFQPVTETRQRYIHCNWYSLLIKTTQMFFLSCVLDILYILHSFLNLRHTPHETLTICHTCMMLSSDTEQMTHGSLGFQEKSEILAVCPPWMNWRETEQERLTWHLKFNSGHTKVNNDRVCRNWPAAQGGHPRHPLVTVPLRSCWGPTRWASCQCRWRPGWFRYEETTEPVRQRWARCYISATECSINIKQTATPNTTKLV